MPVISIHNPLIQAVRKAARSSRPTADGMVLAEGPHLLREALGSAWRIEQVLCTDEARQRFPELLQHTSLPLTQLPSKVFASIATTETSQEVLTLLHPRRWSWEEITSRDGPIVVLDSIQDPGNAGTMIRSAEAFSSAGVILTEGCARASNSKLLRATAGSIFRVPFLEGISAAKITADLRRFEYLLYALSASGSTLLSDARFNRRCAVVIGNEGSGVSPELLASAHPLKIPTHRVESLNAASACAIALYEAARQRFAG
jgi:RNA methyltransferase, TrmH family